MNYVINCSPWHTIFIPSSNKGQPEGGRIGIVSKQEQLGLERLERIVMLNSLINPNQNAEEKKDSFLFTFKGHIKSHHDTRKAIFSELNPPEQNEYLSSRKSDKRANVDFYIHEYDVIFKDTFKENPFLDDYTYSLQGIFNYTQPYRHFSRKITNLDDFDFETLRKEQLFTTRTVFGRLFFSLPIENQLEFLQLAIEEYKTTDFSTVPLIKGVEFLYDYSQRITQLGKVLLATYELLNTHLSDIIDLEKTGFGSTKIVINEKGIETEVFIEDTIEKQVSLFNKAFEYEKGVHETIELITKSTQRKTEERFEKQFKNKSWPIKINL